MGSSGGMCTLPGLRKWCLSSWEGCTGLEQRKDSESLDLEWKSVVCVCSAGTCEVGVRVGGAEGAEFWEEEEEEYGLEGDGE